MIGRFLRAVLVWLGVFELLAGLRGWWGLSWLGRVPARQPAALACLLAGAHGRPGPLALLLAAPLALAAQAGAASLRNAGLNPLLRLRPGQHPSYTIDRYDLPLSQGYMPALHVAPHGGATAAVAVLHGSGCNKTFYAWRLVDTLIAHKIAVLLIDLDGHGDNPRVQSYPAIIEDAAAAVAWLRERYARVGLIGISLGGCIAARAVAEGAPADALVVLEAPPTLQYTEADRRREALALVRPHLFGIFSDCTPYALLRAWESPPIRATIGTHALIERLDLRGSLARSSIPLLVLYGQIDAIVKPTQAEEVRRILPEGATFRMIRGASHLTLIMTPEALTTIGTWLEATLRLPEQSHPESAARRTGQGR